MDIDRQEGLFGWELVPSIVCLIPMVIVQCDVLCALTRQHDGSTTIDQTECEMAGVDYYFAASINCVFFILSDV